MQTGHYIDFDVTFNIPVVTRIAFDVDENGCSVVTGKPITKMDAIINAIGGFDHDELRGVLEFHGYGMLDIDPDSGIAHGEPSSWTMHETEKSL